MKFKIISSIVVIVLLAFMAVALESCNSNTGDPNAVQVQQQ